MLGVPEPPEVTGVRLRNLRTGAVTELACDGVFIAIGHTPVTELVAGQLPLDAEGYILTAPGFDRDRDPGRLRRRRRQGQGVPPGGDRRRAGLHGRARGGEVYRRAGGWGGGARRRVARGAGADGALEGRPRGQEHGDGLGQVAGFSRCRRGGQLHPCGRGAQSQPIGGQPADQRARGEPQRAAVSPPCARPDPDRAGRAAVPHRARGVRQAGDVGEPDLRIEGPPEGAAEDHHDGGVRLDLADAAHPRVSRSLSPRSRSAWSSTIPSSTCRCARPMSRSACRRRASPT